MSTWWSILLAAQHATTSTKQGQDANADQRNALRTSRPQRHGRTHHALILAMCVCVRVCVRVCIVSHLRVHQGTGNDMEPRPHCLHVRHGSVPPGTVALQQFRVVFVGQQLLGCGRQRERKDGSVSGCWRLSARVRARQTRDIWFCSWCLSVSEQPCRHR